MAEELQTTSTWHSALDETFAGLLQNFADYLPQLLGAVLLLLVGWLVAHIAKSVSKKVIHAFDSVFGKLFAHHHAKDEHFKKSYTRVIGQVVFWFVLMFFATASANLLGWSVFSGSMNTIIGYLPRILAGLFIILCGYFISNVAQSLIVNTDLKIGATQTAVLATTARIGILIIASVIGVEHMGLDMHFLTWMVTIVIGVLLAGACLAFGLGAKGMVANTVGAQYIRRNCRVGENIKLAGYEGEILEIRQTCIVLDTAEGRAIVPAKLFHEMVTVVYQTSEPVADLSHAEDDHPGEIGHE